MTCVYSPQKQMGRPRKRRREHVPLEDAQEGQLQNSQTIDEFGMQTFETSGLGSNTNPTVDFPGYQDVLLDSTFPDSLAPPSYPESFAPVPAYNKSW